MEPGVLRKPSLLDAPGYWLFGKRLPAQFRLWLSQRVMRDDYRVVIRRRNLGMAGYLLVLGLLLGSSVGLTVALFGLGYALYLSASSKEPSLDEKRRLLAWHGVTPDGLLVPPDAAALRAPLSWQNRWALLGWAAAYVVAIVGIHVMTHIRVV